MILFQLKVLTYISKFDIRVDIILSLNFYASLTGCSWARHTCFSSYWNYKYAAEKNAPSKLFTYTVNLCFCAGDVSYYRKEQVYLLYSWLETELGNVSSKYRQLRVKRFLNGVIWLDRNWIGIFFLRFRASLDKMAYISNTDIWIFENLWSHGWYRLFQWRL